MARGRSSVERSSDTHTPHPFLSFFFLSSLFSFLEGLKPTHTPVRSPGTTAPLAESLLSRRPLQVTPPLPCAPSRHGFDLVVPTPALPNSSVGRYHVAVSHGGAQEGRRGSGHLSPSLLPSLKCWLCPQVDMPHTECKDQEPQPLGESKEQQLGEENCEEEAGRGLAR